MLSVLLKILYIIQQILYLLRNTVMIFIKSLWLENIITLIHIRFSIKLVNQVLLMYLSLYLLTQLKTLTLDSFRRYFFTNSVCIRTFFEKTARSLWIFRTTYNCFSSAFDELRNKQHRFETPEVDKVKRLNNPHHCLLKDLAQVIALQYTFFHN